MTTEDMQNVNNLVERIQNRLKQRRMEMRASPSVAASTQPKKSKSKKDDVPETSQQQENDEPAAKRRPRRKAKTVEDSSGRGVIYIVCSLFTTPSSVPIS